MGISENEPSTKRSIDEIRTWKFARLLLFLDLLQEDGYINGNLLIEYEPRLPYGDQSWYASCETELAMHNRVSQSTAIFIFVRVRNNRTYVQVYIQCVLPYALLYVVY